MYLHLESKDLMEKYSKKSLEKAKEFDIDEIEHKESEIYLKLIREIKNEWTKYYQNTNSLL